MNKGLDMKDHSCLVTPQFIEDKSQENSNASRRRLVLLHDLANYRDHGSKKALVTILPTKYW
ncbi:MAG TPA: hypothetical protein VFD60_13275 [Nitrososphaeraceae archaeon]|nr:hypothetical protein [Nitrososphaeraceae archaeon]